MTTMLRSLGSLLALAAAICLLATAAVTVGCASSDSDEGGDSAARPARLNLASPTDFDQPPPPGELPSNVWPRQQYYRNALALMDNTERMGFFEQSSDHMRDLYLREIGADARLDLQVMLEPGMSLDEVQQRFPGEHWEDEPVRYGFSEVYVMQRFNGRGYTRMMVTMLADELDSWSTYSDQQWRRDEAILAECSRLERELGRFLEKGMSASGLRNYMRVWPVQHAQIYLILADTSRFARSRESHDSRIRRREFESRLSTLDLLAVRTNPNAAENTVAYYERDLREPDAERTEVNREFWRYDLPFGDRTIHIYLVWDEAELVDYYAEPMPDTVDVR